MNLHHGFTAVNIERVRPHRVSRGGLGLGVGLNVERLIVKVNNMITNLAKELRNRLSSSILRTLTRLTPKI